MTTSRKTSITLPPGEQQQVLRLRQELGLESNVDVIRRALRLLEIETETERLRRQYRAASLAVRDANADDSADLDLLADEGLEP